MPEFHLNSLVSVESWAHSTLTTCLLWWEGTQQIRSNPANSAAFIQVPLSENGISGMGTVAGGGGFSRLHWEFEGWEEVLLRGHFENEVWPAIF